MLNGSDRPKRGLDAASGQTQPAVKHSRRSNTAGGPTQPAVKPSGPDPRRIRRAPHRPGPLAPHRLGLTEAPGRPAGPVRHLRGAPGSHFHRRRRHEPSSPHTHTAAMVGCFPPHRRRPAPTLPPPPPPPLPPPPPRRAANPRGPWRRQGARRRRGLAHSSHPALTHSRTHARAPKQRARPPPFRPPPP